MIRDQVHQAGVHSLTHRVLHKRRAVRWPCTFRRRRVHARSNASSRHGPWALPLQTKRAGQQPHPVVLPETSRVGGACLCCAEGPAEIPAGVSRAAWGDAPRATGAVTAPHFPQKDAPARGGRVRAAWPSNLKMMVWVLGAACMTIAGLQTVDGVGEGSQPCEIPPWRPHAWHGTLSEREDAGTGSSGCAGERAGDGKEEVCKSEECSDISR